MPPTNTGSTCARGTTRPILPTGHVTARRTVSRSSAGYFQASAPRGAAVFAPAAANARRDAAAHRPVDAEVVAVAAARRSRRWPRAPRRGPPPGRRRAPRSRAGRGARVTSPSPRSGSSRSKAKNRSVRPSATHASGDLCTSVPAARCAGSSAAVGVRLVVGRPDRLQHHRLAAHLDAARRRPPPAPARARPAAPCRSRVRRRARRRASRRTPARRPGRRPPG